MSVVRRRLVQHFSIALFPSSRPAAHSAGSSIAAPRAILETNGRPWFNGTEGVVCLCADGEKRTSPRETRRSRPGILALMASEQQERDRNEAGCLRKMEGTVRGNRRNAGEPECGRLSGSCLVGIPTDRLAHIHAVAPGRRLWREPQVAEAKRKTTPLRREQCAQYRRSPVFFLIFVCVFVTVVCLCRGESSPGRRVQPMRGRVKEIAK